MSTLSTGSDTSSTLPRTSVITACKEDGEDEKSTVFTVFYRTRGEVVVNDNLLGLLDDGAGKKNKNKKQQQKRRGKAERGSAHNKC